MKMALIPLIACLAAGVADAHGDAELYVSSETLGGPMIAEIVVRGAASSPGAPEPAVTFGGADLRMIQGTDWHWYAYVADTGNARTIDGATAIGGTGLDFGIECGPGFLDGAFDPGAVVFTSGRTCDPAASPGFLHVLNGARPPASGMLGEEPFDTDHWPFIQTFDLDTEMHVAYGDLQKTITFDENLDRLAVFELDRESYQLDSDVRLTIKDRLLNVDPTNVDAWTFDADGSGEVYSCIFDETGSIAKTNGTVVKVDPDLIYHYGGILRDAGFGKNGMLETAPPGAVFMDNALQDSTLLPSIAGSLVTVRETAPNSGIFTNTDRLGAANLRTGGAEFAIGYGGSFRTVSVESGPAPGISIADLRTLDVSGTVGIDAGRQATITSEISNRQGVDQDFAYVMQIRDGDGSTVYLAWITGRILSGQTFEPAISWVPAGPGEYTVTASVWESLD
ncbi:MAG: hypothetical protein EB830_06680, partial [Nitrosopumilus sp. H13]